MPARNNLPPPTHTPLRPHLRKLRREAPLVSLQEVAEGCKHRLRQEDQLRAGLLQRRYQPQHRRVLQPRQVLHVPPGLL